MKTKRGGEKMKIDYFQPGMVFDEKVDFSISKAKLQEDLKELLAKGAEIEVRPFNCSLKDLINKEIFKIEYWQSLYNDQKIVLISNNGSRLIIKS